MQTLLRGLITAVLFLNFIPLYAQLDTRHYIPPFFGREDVAEGGNEDIYLLISTPQTTAFEVTVTDGAGNALFASPILVSNAAPVSIPLSTAIGASKGPGTKFLVTESELATTLTDEGLILSANKAFFANIRVDETSQAGFLTSKGTAGFGTEFRSGHIWNISGEAARKAHIISFIATEDGTTVTVNDFGGVDFENVDESSGTITVPLNSGESYVLAAYADNASTDNLNNVNGTRISSDKDIVVNSGSWLAGSPDESNTASGRDLGIDQIAPIEETGFEYVLVKGEGDANENVIVVAHTDGTNIFLNGNSSPVNPSPLGAGDYIRLTSSDYSANDNMYLTANQPMYVYQGLNGISSTNERQLGLNYIPPVICLGGTAVDIPDIDQLGTPVLHIIAELDADVTVNNVDVTSQAQSVSGNSAYETYKLSGYTGDVTVSSSRPVRVALTVGSGAVGGAGFFSGFTTTPVIETPDGYSTSTCLPNDAPVVLTATGLDSYQWYRDGILLNGETNASISISTPGAYTASGNVLGCVDSEQSFPVEVIQCPGAVGVAQDIESVSNVSGSLFDVVYDVVVTNYDASNVAPNLQLIHDITDGLPPGATASIQVAPVIISGTLTSGGISGTYDGNIDLAMFSTSANGLDTELSASGSITIRYTVRVDMSSATSPAYTSQAVVSTAPTGPNDGVTATFSNQDFSDFGSDPDPDGDGDPTETGENDITELCLSNTTILYAASTYFTTGADPTPTITGLSGGTFSSASGLIIDSSTGEIDLSASIVDTYVVVYSFGGLCPVTTTVTIALSPPVEPTVVSQTTNSTTPTITGSAIVDTGAGEIFTVEVNGVTYTLGDGNLSISGTTWTLVIPPGNAITTDGTYDVTATIDDGTGITSDTTSSELIIDTEGPDVVISGQPTNTDNTSSYTVTIEFDEDVTGFDITDIVVGNGSASNLVSVDGNTYTVEITPDGTGDITIDVGAGVATDEAGNDNTAAAQVITIFNVALANPTVNPVVNSDGLPTLTGTWDETNATELEVTVNGVTYVLGTDSELTTDGSGNWILDLSGLDSPLLSGTYEVSIISRNDAGDTSTDTTTGELLVTGVSDSDGDGIADVIDNCPSIANGDQSDTDNDGLGDACDDDADGDGVLNDDEDIDGDGDPSNDDTDGDGIPNYLDNDDDGDGIPTSDEDADGDGDPTDDDTDGDGIPDYLDDDDDGDGAATSDEDVDGNGDPTDDDTDNDGTPNYLDDDDDGDGIPTSDEDSNNDGDLSNDDCDRDGTPDYLDADLCSVAVLPAKGFSPNGDANNETWAIDNIENYPGNVVRVFNRWGNEVIKIDGYNNVERSWRGQSDGRLTIGSEVPDGTYFYMIDLGDGSEPLSGYVIIKR